MGDTSAKVYAALPIPTLPATCTRSPPLTEEQEAKYQEVLKQFSGEDYQVPGEGDKNHLTDIEKCWVVRSIPGTTPGMSLTRSRAVTGVYPKISPRFQMGSSRCFTSSRADPAVAEALRHLR